MFDENISGELPEHIDFIKNKAIPKFEEWGYEVNILHADKTYMSCFHHRKMRGKQIGMKEGFVMSGHCDVQRDCKLKPIGNFWKKVNDDYTQYIGIAVDEPVRMNRIVNSGNKVSLLEKYGYTEKMAFDLCKKYDMLSPIYVFAPRGGCWFCPNMRREQLKYLRTNHKDLWNKLLELENVPNLIGNKWNTLTNTSIHDWEERFYWEEQQMTIFDFMEEEK